MVFRAGVVAVQGDVSEHASALNRSAETSNREVDVVEIRTNGVVPTCDLLLLPGGESTTISRILYAEGIATEIQDHAESGKPVLATCAGLIVSSRDAHDERVRTLDIIDVAVDRNAFGRQKESFEAPLDVKGLSGSFPAVFIRAPLVNDVGDVEVLATWDGSPVAVRDGSVVGTAFHPELTPDSRMHRLALFHDTISVV